MSLRASEAARAAPDRLALVDDAGALTWAQVADEVRRRGARLRAAGLAPGDRALVVPTPSREGALTLLSLLELGSELVLAHPRWTPSERAAAVARTEPRLVLEDGRIVSQIPSGSAGRPIDGRGVDASGGARRPRSPAVAAPRAPEGAPRSDSPAVASPRVIVFTSGSTGRPKAVRIAGRALEAAAEAHARALPWRPEDRWLLAMPLAHVGGLSILTRALWARAAVAIGPSRFSPEGLVDAAARHRATLVSLVPTMLEDLLDAALAPPPTVRAALLGGAACPPARLARGRAAGWPLLPTYGTSETCAQVCTQRLGDERPDGVGPPLPGVSVRVVDGEIQVAGPTVTDGLLDAPAPFDGAWVRTGDRGLLDDEGHLHVRGRLDERIVSGGENVDPLEVEHALLAHPAVRAACVVGVPDERWGQRVAAAVVRREPVEPAELEDHLRARLAGFKRPRAWRIVDALPRTPSGKTDRAAVRAWLARGRS